MLVQNIKTGNYIILSESEFTSDYRDYSDNPYIWFTIGSKLTDILTIRENLKRIDSTIGFDNVKDKSKLVLAKLFCTSQSNIDSLLSKEEQIKIIQESYAVTRTEKTHEAEGSNYFNNFRAGLVYDYRHGIKSDIAIFNIENILESVTNKLIAGDWMSAKALCSEITPSTYLTQTILDNLLSDFNNYIINNY